MSSNPIAYAQKRRSSRLEKAISLAVQGVDASHSPFREEVTTLAISCHGCSCQMRHEVLQGAMLVLDMGQRGNGHSEFPTRARVKWVQKLHTYSEPAYGVAVEFESAGNIWGLASPPEDWPAARASKSAEPPAPGRELRLITRTEPQSITTRNAGAAPVPSLKKSEAAASLSPWFSNLMSGISNQIQTTVTEMAALTLANERNRLLEEFRAQLQTEAHGTIERVIETSKEDLARRALKVLNEASEATVRSSHERLIGAIEQDIENARQRMLVQGNELDQRVDSMTTRTIEQLQRTLETSRTEAAARFVSRLREQVAPVLQEAKADLQKLVASQTVFKEESQAIYVRVTSELESSVNARLLQTHDELDKNSALVLSECNEKLLELSQTFENVARDSVQTLIASATDDAKKDLEDRAGEISNIFTDHLEGHVRNYLEFIGDSIAEFPKKPPTT
ncbi:MAG TPA: hypothetical protein VK770_06525 [Candidatus Acidoferrum sp.]|jgi:hypothetical protein|nr:hypothetical protein [Candidatus Acidoferrum sp.]